MISDLKTLEAVSADTQEKLLQLEQSIKRIIELDGSDGCSVEEIKQNYADTYRDFVLQVNPDLVVLDPSHEKTIKQTRLSPIGENIGARAQEKTTSEMMASVQSEAFAVHNVLSKLSVDQRVDLMTNFNAEVMPALGPALSTMITVGVGKSVDAASGELGKAAQWFSFLADEEQKQVIKNVAGHGIKPEGFHVRDGKGVPITDIEQLSGKLNVTFYNASSIDEASLPGTGVEAKGNGITFSQPPKNYPFALGVGDPLLAMFAGNGTVMKVPADMQDIMNTFAQYWNQYVADYVRDNQSDLDLSDDDIDVLSKKKTMQVVTGYGYEAIANNVRVVSSLDVGRQVYESYTQSKTAQAETAQGQNDHAAAVQFMADTKRFSAELAGANVMYIGADLSDEELQMAAKQWLARVIDNNGMICTKIEDGMVHKDVADKFRSFVEKEWLSFDADTVGRPHESGKLHGVHTDPGALQKAKQYLDDATQHGANVIGGDMANDGLSMTPAMVFWPDNVKDVHLQQRAQNIENFAPVSNFMSVENIDQAIEITNISQCNLTSSLWSKDPEDIAKFVKETKLGSYNIFNPKHGSDNAPYGEHIGVYYNVRYVKNENSGDITELHIEDNGVTGGHSQILGQLQLNGVQNARYSLNFDGDNLGALNGNQSDLALRFNILAMVLTGVDLERDTMLSGEQIETLAAENGWSLAEIAPSYTL